MMGKPKAVLIGAAGKQGKEYWELLQDTVEWVGVADHTASSLDFEPASSIVVVNSWKELVASTAFDVAVLTLPHQAHFEVTEGLLRVGKHVIKEKPFAVSMADAQKLIALSKAANRSLFTITQRPFLPSFSHLEHALSSVGKPFWFVYQYHMNLAEPTSGWRAIRELSHGGVLLDMGYHILDVLVRIFGKPDFVRARFSYCFEEMQLRSLEDAADIALTYRGDGLQGTIHLSRHHYRKVEQLEILSTKGSVVATPTQVETFHLGGDRETTLYDNGFAKNRRSVQRMFCHFLENLENTKLRESHLNHHLDVVSVMEDSYESCHLATMLVAEDSVAISANSKLLGGKAQ